MVNQKNLREAIETSNHGISTRSAGASGLKTKSVLNVAYRSWSFQAPQMWNSLPVNLRKIDTFIVFKQAVTSYILSKSALDH